MTKYNVSLSRPRSKNPYRIVASPDVERILALACDCGEIIHKRVDSFLVGMHVAICLRCDNQSTEVVTPDGRHHKVTAEDHQGTGM
jgi:hypothetical protein